MTAEICNNGIDDDGDGQADCADADCNGFNFGPTSCGNGVCASTGNLVCSGGTQVDTCTPGSPTETPEATCNDTLDNDCDGLTDGADPDCTATPEICDNGTDDDGDGLADCADNDCNNFVYGPTSCGVGECAANGQEVCQTPNIVDTCTPGTPGTEGPFGDLTCSDGLDNDCDAATDGADPDCACVPTTEICDDGVDNDCDGLIDCADTADCSANPACQVASTPPKNKFNIVMNYELGMHCTGFEFAYCCVLPPYNSILAQVIKTEKDAAKPRLLTADHNVGLDGLGRPTVVRDTELDGAGNFKKYVLRYWHDAQPRTGGVPGSAPQSSTLISHVEGNSLLMWNTQAEGGVVDANGALVYGTTDGSSNVIQGNFISPGVPDFRDTNDNYWNAVWNHLYIYENLEGANSTNTSAESAKVRLGIHVLYPENTGAALHPMGPNDGDNDGSTWADAGASFSPVVGNVLTFSGDTGTVVYTQMKVLENLPVMLTSPRIWEALGLPLTPFEDTINFFGDPGAVDEPTIRPYVQMKAQLHEYDPAEQFGIGAAVLDGGNAVVGMGTAPIDIPNCERCHSLGDGASVNSAQNGKPLVDQQVQEEMAFWNAYYGINPAAGDSDWYSRLKGAAISILAIHDVQHGTSFMANWPATNGVCSAGLVGNACGRDADCDTLNGFICTSGSKNRVGNPCDPNVPADCGNKKDPGTCEQVTSGDGVCDVGTEPQITRLGHGSVMCQRCHADNVIAVVKSANGPGGNLIPPLTEAIHLNHKDNPFTDALGRDGSCQGCHPAHRSDGDMANYPITELGLNAFAGGDNRDAAGGCFVGRDVHSNRNKDADGAGTPEHLNAVGQWLQANVAADTGTWKGIWCTNCHSQLGQELWKTDAWTDPVHNLGTSLRNAASLADIATGLGVTEAQVVSWLDPKGSQCDRGRDAGKACTTNADCRNPGLCVPQSADGVNNTFAVWNSDPGLCDYVGSLFGGTASPYQDGNVATIEVALNDGVQACSAPVAVDGPDCDGNGQPDFFICGSVDGDGDFSVNALTFCTTPDCVTAAQAGLSNSAAVPVPMSAATDGRDHWLSPGEPHCADCHASPYVEQSGSQHAYPPFNYPDKPALFRYTRGHQDITCQGCHESIHGLYPVVGNIDTTSYAQAAGMNTDGSHGPLNCGACHMTNDATGVIAWADQVQYNGQPIANDFDAAISWAHTYTDEVDPRTAICQNCHGDLTGAMSATNGTWQEHTMVGRVSRSAMDKAEVAQLGEVSGTTNPLGTVCLACHGNNSGDVDCADIEWKLHLTEGRVAESVWEAVSNSVAGSTCGY